MTAARAIVDRATREAEWQRVVTDCATRCGWWVLHNGDSRRVTVRGYPDLTMIRGDVLLFAELKTMTGRLSAAQVQVIGMLRGAGQVVYVWRPGDFDEVMEVLR